MLYQKNTEERMDSKLVEEIVQLISGEFEITAPAWRWRDARNSQYLSKEHLIELSPRDRMGLDALLHEMAHAVFGARKLPRTYYGGATPMVNHHCPKFFEILRQVAGIWYGDA